MPCRCARDSQGDLFHKARGPRVGPGVPSSCCPGCLGDVFQLEERQAIGVADVAYLDDIGVLEPGDGFASVTNRATSSGPA